MRNLILSLSVLLLFFACSSPETNKSSNTDDIAIITTDFGEIHLVLYDETPLHKENFLKLVKEGFYDSTAFHRVMNNFMIQGGDPNSKDAYLNDDGQGGPGYTIEANFRNDLIHKKGALAAARQPDQVNPEKRSSGSQFYIVHGQQVQSIQLDQMQAQRNRTAQEGLVTEYLQAPENAELLAQLRAQMAAGQQDSVESQLMRIERMVLQNFIPVTYTSEQRELYATLGGTPFLDGNYTVFGEVLQGLDVVDAIAATPTTQSDQPIERVFKTIRIETMSKKDITNQYGYSYE